MATNETHEAYRRDEETARPPDRQFGLVFAAVFAVIGLLPLVRGGAVRWWSVAVAVVFVAVALTFPGLLAPLNRVWLRFGLLLHRIVTPVVLGLVYFSTVTPIGLIMRLAGRDPLRLRIDRNAVTYWIERRPPGPPGRSMPNQF